MWGHKHISLETQLYIAFPEGRAHLPLSKAPALFWLRIYVFKRLPPFLEKTLHLV